MTDNGAPGLADQETAAEGRGAGGEGWLGRILARQIVAADQDNARVPPQAFLLSLLCLSIPVLGSALLPEVLLADTGLLLWILALVPPFLLSYYRGWRGAAMALGAGMAAFSIANALVLALGYRAPSVVVILGVIAMLVVVSVGSGVLSAVLRRALTLAREQALIDARTGLPNAHHLMLHLYRMFAAAQRGRLVSVAHFDIDGLAGINARHGRSAGDEVILTFARILKDRTRTMNISGRMGSDEFLAVLDGASARGALVFAERVRNDLRGRRFAWGVATASAGIAQYEEGMVSPEIMVAAADQALYRAKSGGEDRAVLLAQQGQVPVTVGPVDDAADASGDPAGAAEGETVLVVDDDPSVLQLLAKILMRAGYQVLEAHGPTEAIGYADPSYRIDLVVSDIVMPEMSGFRLVEVLSEQRPGLRALYVSGYSREEIQWGGVPGAAKHFMAKPLEPRQLVGAVRRVLDAPLGQQTIEEAPTDALPATAGAARDSEAGPADQRVEAGVRGDDELVRHLIGRLAGAATVRLVESGSDADAAARTGPDILVVEELTPDRVEGWERGDEPAPDLVIALDYSWGLRIKALELGIIDVLPHDMLAGELEARIVGAVRRRGPRSRISETTG